MLAVAFTAFFNTASAADRSYAHLKGDTLVVGNSCIERSFLWNGGELITREVLNRRNGQRMVSSSRQPDFVFSAGKHETSNAVMECVRVEQTAVKPAHMLVRVSYTSGELDVRREFRVYDDVPAIACDTYLKGHAEHHQVYAEGNSADRSNIEDISVTRTSKPLQSVLDRLELPGRQWQCRAVEFWDVTDWNNTLVQERRFISYNKTGYRGNLLFVSNAQDESGFWFLKEAPCSGVQLSYTGSDFTAEFGKFSVNSVGLNASDLSSDEWTPAYSVVLGVCGADEYSQLMSLRSYQKQIRRHLPERDEMIVMNTWGDRGQDTKVNEAFCLSEIEKAARLGVTLFQIDDGWQQGKSPNSAVAKGSFKNIWDNPLYWTPDPVKYPRGLDPIVERGKELGVEVGLWFNPSIQNEFEDWAKDAEAVLKLYRRYGIKVFKIDGVSLPTKKAEMNLRRFFDTVVAESGNEVVFNLDVTAGRRGGYHYFGEYGNIFMENRYTDWQNYYPYWTLRNIWMLSKYVPAEKLQVEFLNPWRNDGKYGEDIFAPSRYTFGYIFATAMAGQPLAWMEAGNLPEEAYGIAGDMAAYRKHMAEFHGGSILPIGEEPDGRCWTGFQSVVSEKEGYVLVFREDSEHAEYALKTWLPDGCKVVFEPICGCGRAFSSRVTAGCATFRLREKNTYALYKYRLK